MTGRWTSDLHWRRASLQGRSARTQERLLDAAEALIVEAGTEGASIAAIAARAGCSVGAVYHHFRDRKALLLAIFHRMTEAYEALNRAGADPARWQGAGVRDLIRGYLEITLAASRDSGAAKAAASAVMAEHPELAAHYAEIQAETRRALLRLVLARRAEIGAEDPEAAARFAIDQAAAMLRARLDPGQRAAALEARPDADFVEEALRMVAGYLALPPD